MPSKLALTDLLKKDLAKIRVSLPGRKLVFEDRFGDEDSTLHERIQKCKTSLQERGLLDKDQSSQDRVASWKELFLSTDLSNEHLLLIRQLAVDLSNSDAVDLFGKGPYPEYDVLAGAFTEEAMKNHEVCAFLAARDLLPYAPSRVMEQRKKRDAEVAGLKEGDQRPFSFTAAASPATGRKEDLSVLTSSETPRKAADSLKKFPSIKALTTNPLYYKVSLRFLVLSWSCWT